MDGDCFYNAVLEQVEFRGTGDCEKFKAIYLKRFIIAHFIIYKDLFKKPVSELVRALYGAEEDRMDAETPGPFSLKSWAKFQIKDGTWADAIIPKLLASLWGCRVTIFGGPSGAQFNYRGTYELMKSDIILLFNDDQQNGHYSAVVPASGERLIKAEKIKNHRFYSKGADSIETKERNKNKKEEKRSRK